MKKWLIILTFLGSGFVIALFALEFILGKFAPHYRTLGKNVINDKYRLINVKNIIEKRWKSNHNRLIKNKLIKTNSHGFRDKERTYEKKEGVFRILLLGDSMTEGLQVPLEQSYPYILETVLNSEDGNKFEVINLSVSGFNTAEEYFMFKSYGLRYQPDLVILAFFNGDDVGTNSWVVEKVLVDSDGGEINNKLQPASMLSNGKASEKDLKIVIGDSDIGGTKREKIGLLQTIKLTSVSLFPNTFYSLSDWVKGIPGATDFLQSSGIKTKPKKGRIPRHYQVYAGEYSFRWRNNWDVTKSLISELANELRVSNTEFLVVIIPSEFEFRSDKWDKVLHKIPKMKTVNFDIKKPERILVEFLESNNINYLLLRPELEAYERKTGKGLYLDREGEIHLNSNGHALLAQLVYRKLKNDYSLIPRARYITFEGESCAAENSYFSLLSSDCLP